KKLAEYLNVHTTYMSQVFHGDRLLNPEQAMYVAEYLGLTELETEYYIKLVQIERAGNDKLKRLLIKEAQKIKERSQQIRNRLTVDQIIPDTFKSVFYSDWYYSAIRLLTSIKGYQDIESISNYFNLPRFLVRDVTDFLLRAGLLEKDG